MPARDRAAPRAVDAARRVSRERRDVDRGRGARNARGSARAGRDRRALHGDQPAADQPGLHDVPRAAASTSISVPAPRASKCGSLHEDEIPWEELAFRTITRTLRNYFLDRKRGRFRCAVSALERGAAARLPARADSGAALKSARDDELPQTCYTAAWTRESGSATAIHFRRNRCTSSARPPTRGLSRSPRIALCSCPRLRSRQNRISITTGGTGGVYYPLGGGMANVLSKYVPGHAGDGRGDRRLGRQPEAHRRRQVRDRASRWPTPRGTPYQGDDKFKGNKVNARTLMVLYPNRMHVVTVEGTRHQQDGRPQGQARVDRLAGQRHRGHGVARARGRGPRPKKDIKQERLGAAESVNAIKDRKIDAFFWVGGVPTAAVTDLARHAGHQDQADRPRRSGRRDEQEVRPAVRRRARSRPDAYPGMDKPQREGRRAGTSWSPATR